MNHGLKMPASKRTLRIVHRLVLCALGMCVCVQAARAQSEPALPASVEEALGVNTLHQQLIALQQQNQGESNAAVRLRQQILEHVLRASFDVDSVLGRIDTEASYASEDRYVLQVRSQRESAMLNLATFAVSGALGAAGSAMQLTRDLNHAGTALSAASGGTALVLSAVQIKGISGGSKPIRSPYNMLAQVLDRTPNAESRYPPLIIAFLKAPSGARQVPLEEGLTGAWRRLHRLQSDGKGDGSSIENVTADRTSGIKVGSDDLADREAMLHDLHAAILSLRTELQEVLVSMDAPGTP